MASSQDQTCKKLSSLDDASLSTVANLVRYYLPLRDLVRLQLVCKEWALSSANAVSLWEARKQAGVTDWYYPTGFFSKTPQRSHTSRRWYGVHHPSETRQALPDLDFLPNFSVHLFTIRAGAGGLLLFSSSHNYKVCNFIVCNPLTKKWRELPIPDPKILELSGNENGIHMVMDDMTNCYEVMIFKPKVIFIYNSHLNQWSTINSSPRSCLVRGVIFGSICSDGRIYFLEMVGDQHVVAEVFLVESRTWLREVYTLFNEKMYQEFFGERRMRGPTLVACMGDLYAIVPLEEEEERHDWPGGKHLKFEVLKLREEEWKFGLWTESLPGISVFVPDETWDGWDGWDGKIETSCRPCSWYTCAARGSVIWLHCDLGHKKRLLQFDVLTGCCEVQHLQCIPHDILLFGESVMRGYEPSLHVNP